MFRKLISVSETLSSTTFDSSTIAIMQKRNLIPMLIISYPDFYVPCGTIKEMYLLEDYIFIYVCNLQL